MYIYIYACSHTDLKRKPRQDPDFPFLAALNSSFIVYLRILIYIYIYIYRYRYR